MLNVRLRVVVMVAGLGLGWTFMAPPAATAQCTYDVYPSSVDDVAAAGASGSLSVSWTHPPLPFDVDPLCGNQWSGVSNDSWISTSTSDTNNFTLYYTVAANPTAMARTGTITVGGHATFTIDQLAGTPLEPCPPSPRVSRTSLSFTSAGGMQTVDVQEAAHCRYGVRGNPTWIGVPPANVAGDGSVTVTVGRYTGSTVRSGTVTIGTRSVPVTQDPPPCTFQVGYTSREVADDPGQYDVSVTASAPACTWSMSSHETWITILTPTRTGSTHGTYRTASNTTPGSPQRTGNMTVAGQTVTITQRRGPEIEDGNGGGQDNIGVPPYERPPDDEEGEPYLQPLDLEALSEHRDRLVGTFAARTRESNVCRAWHTIRGSAREVFIWNTHRLHHSDMLPGVTALLAAFGRDGIRCGGGEYNRTFMLMNESLRAKFVETAGGRTAGTVFVDHFPKWRRSNDFAGPHLPFVFSIETDADGPRGQVHFSHPDWVRVRRTYSGLSSCSDVVATIRRSDVCDGACEVVRPDLLDCITAAGATYTDTVIRDPLDTSVRGPNGELTVDNTYIFEMDQDFKTLAHDSAPSCRSSFLIGGQLARTLYTENYGDPGWGWQPTACEASHQPGGTFTFESIGATQVRAVNTVELRARIDGLRARFGLPVFAWTDDDIRVGVTPVRAVHLTDLRTALNAAYVAAGRDVPTYTDVIIVALVTPIKAVHLTELRAAILQLEP